MGFTATHPGRLRVGFPASRTLRDANKDIRKTLRGIAGCICEQSLSPAAWQPWWRKWGLKGAGVVRVGVGC